MAAKKKTHTEVVANAAFSFINNRCTRAPAPASLLDSVVPEAAKDLAAVKPFEQKTPVPRGLLKSFAGACIERVLAGEATVEQVLPVLTASERDYVLNVLDEVHAWAEGQGFKVADWYQPTETVAS